MDVQATPLNGVYQVTTDPYQDERGQFARWFCQRELAGLLDGRQIVQINHSVTHRTGAVRGLHFQYPPHAEMKLVRCLRGRVFDVAVDLRAGSATLWRWHSVELSAATQMMLVIPEGCAHGFQALEPDSELLYLHTAFYTPTAEGGIHVEDSRLKIAWPLPISDLSPRDQAHSRLTTDLTGIPL
ncbi:MAG: dTDP-4-dehydrorhamnose 3,5-epimerase family protein [Gammaproteobacteria bacterium]|nr:dTDP-4-dehydrorhamnose 3,5-epimerase family protein [Gammaproteobacteria bacterium]